MDHDYWGAIILALIVLVIVCPSTIDKMRRKMHSRKTTKPDTFFDGITEYQNDFA